MTLGSVIPNMHFHEHFYQQTHPAKLLNPKYIPSKTQPVSDQTLVVWIQVGTAHTNQTLPHRPEFLKPDSDWCQAKKKKKKKKDQCSVSTCHPRALNASKPNFPVLFHVFLTLFGLIGGSEWFMVSVSISCIVYIHIPQKNSMEV